MKPKATPIENGFAGVAEIQAKYTSPIGIITKLVLHKFSNGNLVRCTVGLNGSGLKAEYFFTHIELARERVGSRNQNPPTTIRGTGFDGMETILFRYEYLSALKKVIELACKNAKEKRGSVISLVGEKVVVVPPTILGIVKTQ